MIKVTVSQSTVREMSGVSSKNGKPYAMRFQQAYAHTQDREGNTPEYPEKFEISLDRDQAPYAPGTYTLQPSALYVDRNGRLAVFPRLTPWPAKPTTPAPATR